MVKTSTAYDTKSIPWVPLQFHGNAPLDPIKLVQVSVRRDAVALELQYQIIGDIALLCIPEPRQSTRGDGLWRHSCAELFVAADNSNQYCEFNFSPSTQWAAYQFSEYRQRMQQLQCAAPSIVTSREAKQLTMVVNLMLPEYFAVTSLLLGLSMVIEKDDGQCCYWALRHDREQPDFHRRETWIYNLD